MTFSNLGLIEPIRNAVHAKGYSTPSPIQVATIPIVLEGKDLMASAQTGTGKTAAFVLPLLQQLQGATKTKSGHTRALIITPTRELAAQIQASIQNYGKHLQVTSAVVFGGVNISPQIRQLRRGVDILVATPGRLLDLSRQKAIRFDAVETLVLDEADRMLDMGFIPDIMRIQSLLPNKKQSLLFSATFSDAIRKLAKTMLNSPVEIDVARRNATVETISQRIHPVDKSKKTKLLSHLILENHWAQVLVFCRTKHGVDRLVRELKKSTIRADAIHGNKSQSQRTRTLADFKRGKIEVMVATDIAARGIDIIQLPHVVNYDLPSVPEDYVHRIGRTGRAGSEGEAISLVCADEFKQLRDIERLLNRPLERQEIEGFEPDHRLSNQAPTNVKSLRKKSPWKKRQPSKRNSNDPQTGRTKSDRQQNGSQDNSSSETTRNNKPGDNVRYLKPKSQGRPRSGGPSRNSRRRASSNR